MNESSSYESKYYELALVMTAGVGPVLARYLVSYLGSAKQVFETPKSRLLRVPYVGESLAQSLLLKESLIRAEEELKRVEKHAVNLLFYTDPDFPQRLKQQADAPAMLYYKGQAPLNASRMVAIVGTRKATPYGKHLTQHLVEALTCYQDLIIISGLAYGIDAAAHKAALQSQIPTIGIMGTGMDQIYPKTHTELARQMTEKGGLLTEFPFHTKPDPYHFPARNRIVAGMADAIIVVETAINGGAMITANIANSYHKDVFAIPGNVGNRYSEGCHLLIKQHKAHLLENISDLEYIMNWQQQATKSPAISEDLSLEGLSTEERRVVEMLRQEQSLQLDELSRKSQIQVSQLSSVLLQLELQGFVKVLPGKKFTLC
jgi:DNA processing protein